MNVLARYHALLRERTGKTEENIELAASAKVKEVLAFFEEQYPELAGIRPSLTVAVNDEFATADQVLAEGDKVDLLPPFGGG